MSDLDQGLLDSNDESDSSLGHHIQGESWKSVGSEWMVLTLTASVISKCISFNIELYEIIYVCGTI